MPQPKETAPNPPAAAGAAAGDESMPLATTSDQRLRAPPPRRHASGHPKKPDASPVSGVAPPSSGATGSTEEPPQAARPRSASAHKRKVRDKKAQEGAHPQKTGQSATHMFPAPSDQGGQDTQSGTLSDLVADSSSDMTRMASQGRDEQHPPSDSQQHLPTVRAKKHHLKKQAPTPSGDSKAPRSTSEQDPLNSHQRAWELSYLSAHEHEIAALAKARSQPQRPTAAEQGARAPRIQPVSEPLQIPQLPPVPKAPSSSIVASSSPSQGAPAMHESHLPPIPGPSSSSSGDITLSRSPATAGDPIPAPTIRDSSIAFAHPTVQPQLHTPPHYKHHNAKTGQTSPHSSDLEPHKSSVSTTPGNIFPFDSRPPPLQRQSSHQPGAFLRPPGPGQGLSRHSSEQTLAGTTGSMSNQPAPPAPDVKMQRVDSAPSRASTGQLPSLRIFPSAQGKLSSSYTTGSSTAHAESPAVNSPTHAIYPQRSHAFHHPTQHQHLYSHPHPHPHHHLSSVSSAHPNAPLPSLTGTGLTHVGSLGGALTIEKPRRNRLMPLPRGWSRNSLSQHYAPAIPPPNLSIGKGVESLSGTSSMSPSNLPHFHAPFQTQQLPQGVVVSPPMPEASSAHPVERGFESCPGLLSPPQKHSSSLSGSPSGSSDASPESLRSHSGSTTDVATALRAPPSLSKSSEQYASPQGGPAFVPDDSRTPVASQANRGSYFVPQTSQDPGAGSVGLGISGTEDSSDEYEDEEDDLATAMRIARASGTVDSGWNEMDEGDLQGEVLLAGPAGCAAASRRPPEYDTGAGKDGPKVTWPWRHLTRDVMETIKDRSASATPSFNNGDASDADPAASSLVIHSRFAVFAVSGSTILTAQNNKVKIFRAGTVRAEVAGITDAAMAPSLQGKGDSTRGLGTMRSPDLASTQSGSTGTEKVATVADTPRAPSRVTALCFLSPQEDDAGTEETGRYAWVGTASGMIWELDVLKETRVALNRLVHRQPILHIARMGRRMCVVDEGGKISTWTPPARGRSGTGEGHSHGPPAPTSSACGSAVSLSLHPSTASGTADNSNQPPTTPLDASSPPDVSTTSSSNDLTSWNSAGTEGPTPGLLGTKAITQRVSVEGKACVPLLVGDQLWVASGGVTGGSQAHRVDATAANVSTTGSKKKHSMHRSLRRSVRAAAGAAGNVSGAITGSDLTGSSGDESFHKSVRLHIYNPFADDRPFVATMVPPTLPPQFTTSPVGFVTDAAIVPASAAPTVFLSHTTGHISEWSRRTHQCVAVHQQSAEPILCLTAAGRYLWAGTKGGLLLVYGLGDSTGRARHPRGGTGSGSGSRLVLIKAWCAHEGSAVTALVTDPDSVKFGRLQVVSGGLDGAVRIWDGLLTHDWFERRLQRAEPELASHRTIRSLQVTYNIDAAEPEDLQSGHNANFLRDLLRSAGRAPSVTTNDDSQQSEKPIGPEIIVFGLQELIDLEDKRLTAKNLLLSKKKIGNELGERISTQYSAWRTTLINAVDETFGAGAYELVESELLVGLMTCLFVASREIQAGNIRETAVGTVKTGFFGGRYGNKGAVVTRLMVDDSSLCFVNCHLAAGQSHVFARNTDASTIINTPRIFPRAVTATAPGTGASDSSIPPRLRRAMAFTRGGDGSQILDHEAIFWSGDLNYRINLGRNETLRYLTSGNIAALLDVDQLADQSNTNERFALRAFVEAPISFPPTYKYNRMSDTYDTSAKQRTPAWCDRILWCDAAQNYPATCVRFHDAQDDAQTETVLGAASDCRGDTGKGHFGPQDDSSSEEGRAHLGPPSRPTKVISHAYRSWPTKLSDHRPVSAEFAIQVKRIDASKLAHIAPRLRQEWALIQSRLLDEAKASFETSITG